MQVPLRGNSEALEAYVTWEVAQAEPQELPAHVQAGYKRAQAAVELRAPNEDAVDASKAADADLLAAYLAYIGLEQVCASPVFPSPAVRQLLLCAAALHVFGMQQSCLCLLPSQRPCL